MDEQSIEELNTSDDSVPQAVDVAAGEGEENDSSVANLYEVVNQTWGTNFQTDEDALKGLKETKKHVGKFGKYVKVIEQLETLKGGESEAIKLMEELTKEPTQEAAERPRNDNGQFVSKDEYERDIFFSKQSFDEDTRTILNALKGANPDKSWDAVAELPAFKSVYEAKKARDEAENSKQPVTSSSRISAGDTTYEQDFALAKATGNWGAFLEKHKGVKLT